MKTKILLTILTIAILSSPLLAQRDSLCMRTVDEWFEADSRLLDARKLTIFDDYIYLTTSNGLRVYNLSDSGNISLDTTLIVRDTGLREFFAIDTIGYTNYENDLIVLNLSNPSRPDSIYSYTDIFESSVNEFIMDETILVTSEFIECYQRFDISEPMDITEITTHCGDTLSNYMYDLVDIDYPKVFGWSDPRFGETVNLYVSDVSIPDSISFERLGTLERSYVEQEPTWLHVEDTIIYISYYFGALRTYKTNADRDTLILLDTYEDFVDAYGGKGFLKDTLLFIPWGEYIKVFNISDPTEIDLIAFYYESRTTFRSLVYIDDFLVATSSHSIKVFKYPCPECDGNCELRDIPKDLEIKTYPNPFNDKCRISIDNKIEYTNQSISIYDLKGRKVLEENTSSLKHEFIWDAQDEPKGIYLVELSNGKMKNTRKVFLIK
ncbi:MAG: T9SS type A sorting domain-containing protein [Candidatus Zixiibacteriota bacterium]